MLKAFKLPPVLRITAVYLSLLAVMGVGIKLDLEYTLLRMLAFGALLTGFMLIPVLKHRASALKYPFFTNNIITVLIMFLILDEFIPWWHFFVFGAIASGIKHYLRLNRQPVFNPAAAGIVVAVAFGALETWWGPSFSPRFTALEVSIAAFLTLPVGLYLGYKYQKWAAAFSFLATYAGLMTWWLHTFPAYQVLEGTMLFFALIMVSEPKTSPNKPLTQAVFGTLVGILSVVAIINGVASPYAAALLVCNLGFRLFMWWQQKRLLSRSSLGPSFTAAN